MRKIFLKSFFIIFYQFITLNKIDILFIILRRIRLRLIKVSLNCIIKRSKIYEMWLLNIRTEAINFLFLTNYMRNLQFTPLGDSCTKPCEFSTVQMSVGSPLFWVIWDTPPLLFWLIPCSEILPPSASIWFLEINGNHKGYIRWVRCLIQHRMVCFVQNLLSDKTEWTSTLS